MGFAIVLAVIMFFVINNLSSRISKLEKKLEGKIVRHVTRPSENSSTGAKVDPVILQQNPTNSGSIAESISPTVTASTTSGEEGGGKMLGKIGIGAVFFGVAFFIKYAFDNNWVGPSGRIIIGLFIGALLFALGQYLKNKYENFAEILMGGGIAIMYFSIYAAHAFYSLIDPTTSAIALFIVSATVFSIGAIRKDLTLSAIATIGAYITPFLTGSTNNNMYEIFGFITLINLAILGISSLRKWPALTAIALIGTTTNLLVWCINFYNITFVTPVIIFISISFLIFLIASIFKVIESKEFVGGYEYGVITFNTIIFTISIFTILFMEYKETLNVLLLAAGAVFALLSYIIYENNPEDVSFGMFSRIISVIFITIAIILHFSGLTLVAIMLAESLLLFIAASKKELKDLQISGFIIYFLSLFTYFVFNSFKHGRAEFSVILNSDFAIIIVAVVAGYIISWIYQKHGSVDDDAKNEGSAVFVITSNILTLYAFSTQIYFSYPAHSSVANTYVSILWAIYASVLIAIGFAKRISFLRKIGLGLFVITAIKVVADVWSLGQIYRIVSFVVFGVIALIASFAYAKYKDRL